MSRRERYRSARDSLLAGTMERLADWSVRASPETAEAWGRRLGGLAHGLLATERRRTRTHLAEAFPDWPQARVHATAREVFRHLGANLAEVLRIVGGGRDHLLPRVEWVNPELMQDVFGQGRGIVLVTAHTGNWELLGSSIVDRGFPLTVVARGMKTEAMEQVALRLRQRGGMATAVRESASSARTLLAALKSGSVLGLLIDQDISGEGDFVPFFGRPAWTPLGAAVLARRRRAPMLPVLSRRVAPARHQVRVFPPIPPPSEGSPEDQDRERTATATRIIEDWIRETPEQWVWMHRRWKRQPDRATPDT